MPSLLQQLENNEAILLMYLADELPMQDRAEVKQMLEADAGLRRELDRLGDAQAGVMTGLETLDRLEPLRVPESAVVCKASMLMRQWHVDQLSAEPVAEREPGRLRFAWWMYPAAAAASVIIAVIVWWGMKPDDGKSLASKAEGDNPGLYDRGGGWQISREQRSQAITVISSYEQSIQANGDLPEAEQQAMALAAPVDEGSVEPAVGQNQ